MTELVVRPALADLVGPAAEWIGSEVSRAVGERGLCAVALAGGRTPEPVYRKLASHSGISWDRVDVFFTDERAVPPEDPESNYGMIHRALLSRIPISPTRVHRMEADNPDREAAARSYEGALPEHLDLLVLGVGQDGHTASLFPGSPVMEELHRLVVPVIGPKLPPERLTLTPPVIEAARSVVIIATGSDKAAVIARAIEGPWAPREIPAQLARRGRWFLDQAAAERLAEGKVPT
jgi:6-phosphogluconolactonase